MHHFWALRKERGRVFVSRERAKREGAKEKTSTTEQKTEGRVSKLKRAFLSSTHDSIPFFSNLSTTRV
jgi:hypothetical protein